MPFCPGCGKEIPASSAFCANCGKPLPAYLTVPPTKPGIVTIAEIEKTVRMWGIRKYLTRRRLIAVTLIIIAIAIDAWGYFEYAPLNSSPNMLFPSYGRGLVGYYHPAVVFHYNYYFSAIGAISVNNPIHVHAELYQSAGERSENISNFDFLRYYNAIGFMHAFSLGRNGRLPVDVRGFGGEAAIALRRGPYPAPSCPSGEYCPSGEDCPSSSYYCADGDIIFVKEGPSWDYLWPSNTTLAYSRYFPQYMASVGGPDYERIMRGNKAMDCPGDPNCREPIVTVSDVGDTLTAQNNLTIQRLTFILMGFTIVLLLEIVDTIVSEPVKEHPRHSHQGDSSHSPRIARS